jgi:fatty acid/phospholipid biosynthesis enzyme
MVGLTGIVVKSHGRADGVAFARAITTAAVAARCDVTERIQQALLATAGVAAPASTVLAD